MAGRVLRGGKGGEGQPPAGSTESVNSPCLSCLVRRERAAHDGVESILGVVHVAANTRFPLDTEDIVSVLLQGVAKPLNEAPFSTWPNVSAEYFPAMTIQLCAKAGYFEITARRSGYVPSVTTVPNSLRSLWNPSDQRRPPSPS